MEKIYYIDPVKEEAFSLQSVSMHPNVVPVYSAPPEYDSGLQELTWTGYDPYEDGVQVVWEVKYKAEPAYSAELTRRAQARCKQLLLECDWTIGNDSPLTTENQKEWREYRTFLRNINHQKGFPKVIDWGTQPEQVKK